MPANGRWQRTAGPSVELLRAASGGPDTEHDRADGHQEAQALETGRVVGTSGHEGGRTDREGKDREEILHEAPIGWTMLLGDQAEVMEPVVVRGEWRGEPVGDD